MIWPPRKKSAVPADIEDVLTYEEIGTMARFALRKSNADNVTEADWKRFIREIEAKKKGRNRWLCYGAESTAETTIPPS